MSSPRSHDPAFASAMRGMSRAHIADIWRRGKAGETLAGEDQLFFEAMSGHPEYSDFWEHAAELGDREVNADRVNPFLHVSLHAVIERQIADRNPPEVDQALFRLARAGMDRHEALHRIASLLTEIMFESMKGGPSNADVYRRRLRALKP